MSSVGLFRLQQNSIVLETRLKDITRSQNHLEVSIKQKTSDNRQVVAQMNDVKPEIKALSKKADSLRR